MIKNFVDRWYLNESKIRESLSISHPSRYCDLVKLVVSNITSDEDFGDDPIDPDRIHEIDDGDYQGTLLFVIASKGYQPSEYYFVKIDYGSCSGCDTLEGIREYSDEKPTKKQVDQYMLLALHIVQGLKKMD